MPQIDMPGIVKYAADRAWALSYGQASRLSRKTSRRWPPLCRDGRKGLQRSISSTGNDRLWKSLLKGCGNSLTYRLIDSTSGYHIPAGLNRSGPMCSTPRASTVWNGSKVKSIDLDQSALRYLSFLLYVKQPGRWITRRAPCSTAPTTHTAPATRSP